MVRVRIRYNICFHIPVQSGESPSSAPPYCGAWIFFSPLKSVFHIYMKNQDKKKEIERKKKNASDVARMSQFQDKSVLEVPGRAGDPDSVNLPALVHHVATSAVLETLVLIRFDDGRQPRFPHGRCF